MHGAKWMMKSCPQSPAVIANLPAEERTHVVAEVFAMEDLVGTTIEWVEGSSHHLNVFTIGSNMGAC